MTAYGGNLTVFHRFLFSGTGQEGRLHKVYTSLQKSGGLCAVTELPGHALIAAGLGALVNVSVLEEHNTLRGQLGEVSVQGDLHTSGCEANDVEGKSLWR